MKRSMCLMALLVALGLASAAYARVAIGTLAGTVLDAKGKPVAGATVTMQTSAGDYPHATHTDASGHFEFTRYETGQYDLRAYANGMFSEWVKRVSIRRGKTTKVTLHMPPAADVSVTVSK